jgi:ketosteroid isomerase-like protein
MSAADVVRRFYDAIVMRDLAAARRHLHDGLVFEGLFETYPDADAYLKALAGLLSITTRLEVRAVFGEGENAAVFFDLDTRAPVEAKTFVAEWHRVRDGRIVWVKSAFDGRAFAKMFGAA